MSERGPVTRAEQERDEARVKARKLDVTLYESADGTLSSASPGYGANAVPAVIGVTIAEVEGRVAVCECEWENGEGCERLMKAERERDEARAEVKRLRERELDDFTVTADELDAALDRAEKAERERDEARADALSAEMRRDAELMAKELAEAQAARYREALERIAETDLVTPPSRVVRIAREALVRDEPDSEREEARAWARQFNRRRTKARRQDTGGDDD